MKQGGNINVKRCSTFGAQSAFFWVLLLSLALFMPACGGGGGGDSSGGDGDNNGDGDTGGTGGIGGTGGTGGDRIDLSFGKDGGVVTPFGTGGDSANAVAIQADGKIVVAGYVGNPTGGQDQDFGVVRYSKDGILDNSFSGDGKTNTVISANSGASAVAIDTNGKIVAAGWASNEGTGVNEVALVRYNKADGSLDSTFDGDGIVTTAVIANETSEASAVVMQSDGKILVAGWAASAAPASGDLFAVLRYKDNGSLDTTFGGGDGIVTTPVGVDGQANSLAVQGDGKIVVAGFSYTNDVVGGDFALLRYDADGLLDTTFGTGGMAILDIGSPTDQIRGIALDPLDKIVVVGTTSKNGAGDFAVVRYSKNGTLDTGFGDAGMRVESLGVGDDEAFAVAIQSDASIVVVGSSSTGSYDDIALVRFDSNGKLDTTFGSGGRVITPIGKQDDVGNAVAIQSDGTIVVAGRAWNDTNNDDFVVVRYLP